MSRWLLLLFLPFLISCHTARPVTKADGSAIPAKKPSRKAVVSYATKQLKSNYKYGGQSPREGFDCSGLVCYVYAHFGIQLPRTSATQANYGRRVSLKKAKPGDLIFFSGKETQADKAGHVGLITRAAGKQTEFIHASNKGVIISALSEAYYQKRFLQVRSVLTR